MSLLQGLNKTDLQFVLRTFRWLVKYLHARASPLTLPAPPAELSETPAVAHLFNRNTNCGHSLASRFTYFVSENER